MLPFIMYMKSQKFSSYISAQNWQLRLKLVMPAMQLMQHFTSWQQALQVVRCRRPNSNSLGRLMDGTTPTGLLVSRQIHLQPNPPAVWRPAETLAVQSCGCVAPPYCRGSHAVEQGKPVQMQGDRASHRGNVISHVKVFARIVVSAVLQLLCLHRHPEPPQQ